MSLAFSDANISHMAPFSFVSFCRNEVEKECTMPTIPELPTPVTPDPGEMPVEPDQGQPPFPDVPDGVTPPPP